MKLIRLHVTAEGPTEESFVQRVTDWLALLEQLKDVVS